MDADRRQAVRWRIAVPVQYCISSVPEGRQSQCTGQTEDLSMCGARIVTSTPCSLGDCLGLVLGIPGTSKKPIKVEAKVVWRKDVPVSQEGCNYMAGIEFNNFKEYNKRSLLGYVSAAHPQEFTKNWWQGIR